MFTKKLADLEFLELREAAKRGESNAVDQEEEAASPSLPKATSNGSDVEWVEGQGSPAADYDLDNDSKEDEETQADSDDSNEVSDGAAISVKSNPSETFRNDLRRYMLENQLIYGNKFEHPPMILHAFFDTWVLATSNNA